MAKKPNEFDRDAKAPETKPKGKAAEGEQEELIDTDHPEDKPLIKQIKKVAAANKVESSARDASQNERTKLLDMMKEKKLETYRYGRFSASVKHTDKVSVKSEDDNGSSDEE